MKIENVLEVIVGSLMVIIIAILIMPKEEVSNDPIIIEDTFNDFPLAAWKDYNKKGEIVKIRYRVTKENTFIIVVNDLGKVVHKQPFHRDPKPNGTPRDFTYHWMLYDTEDYGDYIPPGDYEIRVCNLYQRNVQFKLGITI